MPKCLEITDQEYISNDNCDICGLLLDVTELQEQEASHIKVCSDCKISGKRKRQ
jgi:ribosome-binding protein aMBF1 (putative translation factor)